MVFIGLIGLTLLIFIVILFLNKMENKYETHDIVKEDVIEIVKKNNDTLKTIKNKDEVVIEKIPRKRGRKKLS
jgi:hypothetical protein